MRKDKRKGESKVEWVMKKKLNFKVVDMTVCLHVEENNILYRQRFKKKQEGPKLEGLGIK